MWRFYSGSDHRPGGVIPYVLFYMLLTWVPKAAHASLVHPAVSMAPRLCKVHWWLGPLFICQSWMTSMLRSPFSSERLWLHPMVTLGGLGSIKSTYSSPTTGTSRVAMCLHSLGPLPHPDKFATCREASPCLMCWLIRCVPRVGWLTSLWACNGLVVAVCDYSAMGWCGPFIIVDLFV